MPQPNKDEKHDEWISRCMGDSEEGKTFPDQKQRYAVCESKWKEHLKKKAKSWLHPESENDQKN